MWLTPPGGGRSHGYLFNATPDVAATNTAQKGFFTPAPSPTASVLSLLTSTPDFNNSSAIQKIKSGAPVTLMLFGYRGYGHAGQWLTDTILLMRYDPKTKTMLQLNIPHDMYVFIPYGGTNNGRWAKIHHGTGCL